MKSVILVLLSVVLFYSAQLKEVRAIQRSTATAGTLEYTLITANSPDCLNSHRFPAPQLQYRQGTDSDSEWTTLPNIQPVSHTNFTTFTRAHFEVSRFVVDLFLNDSQELWNSTLFRFVQSEHRGGFCDCWAVANLTLNESIDLNIQCGKNISLEDIFQPTMMSTQLPGLDWRDVVAGFCQDTALIPREFIAMQGPAGISPPPNCTSIALFDTPQTNCSVAEISLEVSFDLRLWINCDSADDFSEGVELSFRRTLEDGTTSEWIPLMYFASFLKITQPHVWLIPSELPSNSGQFTLRGYHVNYTVQAQNDYDYHYDISMCGGDILQRPLQFRWLQNSYQQRHILRDAVLLDNVTVRMKNSTHYAVLLEDCFDYQNSITASRWNPNLSYNVHLLKTNNVGSCKPSSGGALFFYTELPPDFFSLPSTTTPGVNYTVNSRQLVTNSLDPNNAAKWSLYDQEAGNVLSCEPEVTMTTISDEVTTEEMSSIERTTTHIDELTTTIVPEVTTTITTTDSEVTTEEMASTAVDREILTTHTEMDLVGTTDDVINALESSIQLAIIKGSESLFSQSQLLTLILNNREYYYILWYLNDLLSSRPACDVNLTAAVFILSVVVNDLADQTVERSVSELVLSIVSRVLEIAKTNHEEKDDPPEVLAGSTLLQVIDKFALNNHNISHKVTSDNIVFQIEELRINEIVNIESHSPIDDEPAEIRIPVREVLSGLESQGPVRMASLLFRNMSGLLPERLEGSSYNGDAVDDLVFRLASPVISASFQCDTCTTSNLSTQVQVTFTHTPYDKALLDNDNETGKVACVFWEFNDMQHGALLYQGRWSAEGCETNFNSNMTICRCDHLTHFAILLSARPLELPPAKILSLQIIGYIGVSVSLVAMAATIFVFLFLKALRTMRNYIHIQLCVTLGIAQIIFVAGIEPHLGEGHLVGGVPVGCRLVAVLLHYWFLVSFMWMLMEGVVLYVALVRVFVKYHARYIAAFTIASYGLPLLYVGGLTVPLGFVRTDNFRQNQHYDYGYEQACYLNPATSLIWSFIAPVILIFLVNIGFFIMAIVIMCRHQKRQRTEKKAHKIKHWLKVIVSLTVVMGITWIIGVLVIEVEELCPLAYIFTIFVAFQGVFIFAIFVLLSKQVKENYAKWWKAKVAESDFLSKHFGEKSFSSSATMAQRSAPSSSTVEKSSNGHMASKNIDKSQVVDNAYSECKLPLETSSSCDKANDLENGISSSTFIPLNSNGVSLDSRGVSNGSLEGTGFKRPP